MPEPPEEVFYKDLGTIKHKVCDVIYLRMKGRKMSWSINGATNLSKILALKAEVGSTKRLGIRRHQIYLKGWHKALKK